MSLELERPSAPTPLDVAAFLPYACAQLQAPFRVRTQLITIDDYMSKHDDKGKKARRAITSLQLASAHHLLDREEPDRTAMQPRQRDEDEVAIATVCDAAGRLVELLFDRCSHLPRLLMKVVALCVPYQPLLSKITLRRGPLDGLVLYEIVKVLPQSHITELCLDDSPVPQRNYRLLLERRQLRNLSLARCGLDDDDCAALASELRYPEPAAGWLAALCLASNAISDAGAAALGEALRGNRALRHLNLSGNRISDAGAANVLRSLVRFRLTVDEIKDKRRRHFDYLKLKKLVSTKCYDELVASDKMEKSPEEKSASKRRITNRSKRSSTVSLTPVAKSNKPSFLALKAETMAEDLLGPLADPFGAADTVVEGDWLHSLGNDSLAYLNLAYNNLQHATVLKLVGVLQYQAELPHKRETGLLRVVLDGNLLPTSSVELSLISELLARALACKERVSKPSPRRSERARSKAR